MAPARWNAKLNDSRTAWVDPDDAPEITGEWIKEADLYHGDKLIRRGRPAGSHKTATTIRFDNEVIEAFRAAGPGWQTRMNDALKDWLKTRRSA